jgi:hypothetical protein
MSFLPRQSPSGLTLQTPVMGKLCKLFQMFSRARRMEEARAVMLLVGYGERKTAGSLLTP